jgi:hypothetical protein
MKTFKHLLEETLDEGHDRYPGDDMTQKELKIAINAAKNILDMIEDGSMIMRWQISAIVKASEELASVCTSMRADEEDEAEEDDDEWSNYDDSYVGAGYPSMYGEETELRETETKYVVKDKSPFYKQDHYINTHETPKAQLVKKHVKHATRMNLDTAKKVAKDWESHPNKYKTEVVAVNEEIEIVDEIYEEVGDYSLKKSKEKKATLAHPNGKAIHHILHKGEVVGTVEPYSAYREKKKPGSRIVTSRTNVTHYQLRFHADKGPTKSADMPFHHKMSHTSPDSALRSAAEVHSNWLKKNEETDYKVSVDGLPDMYVKANNPAEVKANLRKVIKKPDAIQSVDRVTQAVLKKIFRDKATGKEDMQEGYNDPIHRKYISDVVHNHIPKTDPKHDKVVDNLHKAKNYGNKTIDSLENQTGIKIGQAIRITKEVAEHMKANFGSSGGKSQSQAQRIDKHLKQKWISR